VKNIDEWGIVLEEFDPSQILASSESLEVFINGYQVFINIIGRAELVWQRYMIVE
jgi:hypothetical protein